MRGLLWLGILLICLAWMRFEAEPLDVAAEPSPATDRAYVYPNDHWRRTPAGWEDRRYWNSAGPSYQPALHPLLVVAFEIMASVAVLIAGNRRPCCE